MWEYNNLDELYHYGILGMRWGRRKSLNEKFAERTKRNNVKADKFVSKTMTKVANKSDKIKTKAYVKAMYKNGNKGSIKDLGSSNRSTKLYNSIKAKEGKKFADNIVKKTNSKINKSMAVNGAALVVTGGYLAYKLKNM